MDWGVVKDNLVKPENRQNFVFCLIIQACRITQIFQSFLFLLGFFNVARAEVIVKTVFTRTCRISDIHKNLVIWRDSGFLKKTDS